MEIFFAKYWVTIVVYLGMATAAFLALRFGLFLKIHKVLGIKSLKKTLMTFITMATVMPIAVTGTLFLFYGIDFTHLMIAFFGAIPLALFLANWLATISVGPVEEATPQIASAANVLSSSTQQTSAAAQQNAATISQIASGAVQQAKEAEDISKIVSRMASVMQQMAASAQEVSSVAIHTSKIAQTGGESGEKSIENLKGIRVVITNVSDMINALSNRSEEIAVAVETITNISEKTNLLALNAAIEAARAGEAGRGFAVVADEVRKLAESSTKSAAEIKDIITSIQDQIIETVGAVSGGVKEIDKSSKIIDDSLGSLSDIAGGTQQVSAKIQEVSAAIQDQASSIQQVAKAIDSIASVAEQNAAGVQQMSVVSEQQALANQTVAAAAQQLQGLTEKLQEMVGVMVEIEEKPEKYIKVSSVKGIGAAKKDKDAFSKTNSVRMKVEVEDEEGVEK